MEVLHPPKLLELVSQTTRQKRFSPKTENAYLYYIRDFIQFHRQHHPQHLGVPEIQAYLSHLAVDKQSTVSTQNVALCALLFLYRQVLHLHLPDIDSIERSQRPTQLPTIFSRDEVKAILACVGKGTEGLVIRLLYGTGMRLSECLRLRLNDVDFDKGQILVRKRNGKKARATILPHSVATDLRQQIARSQRVYNLELLDGYGEVELPQDLARKYPNTRQKWLWNYVFPAVQRSRDPHSGAIRRHHLSKDCIQRAMKRAKQQAGVQRGTCHTLRHTFAIHLLENGYDIRTVQELLGHKDVKATRIYTRLLKSGNRGIPSPLDG
ncbi:MAG: integron integrase [Cyanobacteriota bacterium]|nr:integron integrase [Cyanobacteriota bacterium]